MHIPNKFPDVGAAGAGQCSENHCPKAVSELSAHSHFLQLRHHPVVANAGKISLCYQLP